jgi:tripartite-type tricarboxylate transporter receptor subunit TctC
MRCLLFLCVALSAGLGGAAADDYPSHPIRLVVPFAPGGAVDSLARVIANPLSEQLGQPVVVYNRGGAGGSIGMDEVAKAAPDGYTLLLDHSGLTYMPGFYRNLPFDPAKDFSGIIVAVSGIYVLAVNNDLPVKSVAELIAYAKAHPGGLSYGSAGVGATSHIAAELFKSMAEIDMQHVPYRGTGPALVDLVAGRVQLIIDNLPPIVPFIRNGQLRALAVSTQSRSPLLPDLPTISESGLPGFSAYSWQIVAAPTGTPPSIANRLAAAIRRISIDPEIRTRVAKMGAETVGDTPAEAREFVRQESVKWRAVVDKSGARAD